MACEGYPRNSFRSAMMGEGGPQGPLLAAKGGRRSVSDALDQVEVTRSEGRRHNQRAADRHVRGREEVVVRRGRRSMTVALINLSGGGAMIEGKLDVRLWDKLVLVLGRFGEVECAVRWVRGERYGLEFAHETHIDCEASLRDETLRQVIADNFESAQVPAGETAEADPADPSGRQESRHPLIWSGLIHHHHESVVARLRNISAGGALIQCASHFPPGSDVVLDLGDAGVIPATVSWSIGDQSGLAFTETFDVRRLAACKPDVAPQKWAKPEYLRDESAETSPWASHWDRLTLNDLSRALGR